MCSAPAFQLVMVPSRFLRNDGIFGEFDDGTSRVRRRGIPGRCGGPDHVRGKSPSEDVDLVRRRSPVWNVQKLRTPLLVHTTTNDRDVNVVEVEGLITALKAAGKKFEFKIYQDAPGGHSFNRIDTTLAQDSRKEIYAFLEKHLK